MKDLILLVADKNMQFALKGALERPRALGIRPIEFEFIVHAGRDGGVRETGVAMLGLERRRFSHATLLLDFEGSGSSMTAGSLEAHLDDQFATIWADHCKSIVIEPELEVWM